MQKIVLASIAIASGLCSAFAQPVVGNPSFATPSVGGCPGFVYTPSGGTWTFDDASNNTGLAGITATGCTSNFISPASPAGAGSQAGFIKSGGLYTYMSQSINGFLPSHSYAVVFYAAGRTNSPVCRPACTALNFSVYAGNVDILDVTNPPTAMFQQYTTKPFTSTGTTTITFSATAPSGTDETTYIDLVSIQDMGQIMPSIQPSGVVSASAFGGFSSISPGSIIEIYGSGLGVTSRPWYGSDFTNGNAPASLDGTKVSIGGQSAFVSYVSPGQVNALIPSNVTTGVQQLSVTTAAGTSSPYAVRVNATEPGLLAPASFLVGKTQYAGAFFPDGITFVLPPGLISGVPALRAQAGDTIILYGVGFGPVTPNLPAGQLVVETNTLANTVLFSIGRMPATVAYAGLATGYTGLYQFNVVVPNAAPGDAVPLTFTLGGVAGTQMLNIAVQ